MSVYESSAEHENDRILMELKSRNMSFKELIFSNNHTQIDLCSHSEDVSSSNTAPCQHLPKPQFAAIFLILNLSLMIPLAYFNSLVIRMAKREKKKNEQTLLCNILSGYAKVSIFSTFFVIINANGLMSFLYPLSRIFGTWYCYSIEVAFHICGMYIGTLSLLVAGLRYFFIVHHERNHRIGREKKVAKFVVLYIATIFSTSIVNSLSNGKMDQTFWENQCWGHKNEIQTVESGFLNSIPNVLCYNREYEIKDYIGASLSYYFEPMLRFTCGISTLFCLLVLSNGIELILYLTTLKHMDR